MFDLIAIIAILASACLVMRAYDVWKDDFHSILSLWGKTNTSFDRMYGAQLSCYNTVHEKYGFPEMALSFSTFLELWNADPSKIAICMLGKDDVLPRGILYDKDSDGEADVSISMRSLKDVRAFMKWFRALREEELAESRAKVKAEERDRLARAEVAHYEALVSATETMQKDLKAKYDSQHKALMEKTKENHKWREQAEKRQQQMQAVAGGQSAFQVQEIST